MRKVAAACGLSATAIYRHFADKEALIDAALDEGLRLLDDYLTSALVEGAPLARLRVAALRYLDFARDQPRDYELLFMMPRDAPTATNKGRGTRLPYEFFVTRVVECHAAALFEPGDPAAQATCVWAALHGLASLRLRAGTATGLFASEELPELQIDCILRGLLRSPSRDEGAPRSGS